MDYASAIDNVRYFGSALLKKVPLNQIKDDKIVPIGFYMSNRPECTIAQYGCVCYGYTIVPFYDAYGVEAIKGLIELSNTSVVITDTEKRVGNFLLGYDEDKLKSLKMIIYICDSVNDSLKKLAKDYGIELVNYKDFISIGKQNLVTPNLVSVYTLYSSFFVSLYLFY
jgi:long-subunit acyl-CoA synthetase (AMP-forming)